MGPAVGARAGGYCGSTSTLKPRRGARGRPRRAAPPRRRRRSPARRSRRLDHDLAALAAAQAEQRRRAERGAPAPRAASRTAAAAARARRRARLGRADDPDQRRERRVAQRLAAARARRRGSRRCRGARRSAIERRVGRDRLDEHAPARGAAARRGRRAGRRARTSAPRRGSRGSAASRRRRARRRASTSGKSWPLATIWVPTSTPRAARLERARAPRAGVAACRRRAGTPGWPTLGELVLEALGAGAVAARSRPSRSASQRDGTRSRWPQWWQASRPSARCSTSATSQSGTSTRSPHDRQVRKFDQPRRLSSTIALRARRRSASCGARDAARRARLAHVDHLDRRQRRAVDALRQPQPRAARGSSRAAAWRCRRRARRPVVRARCAATAPRVVARVALVLVGAVVLLVDDDQAERSQRREHRRARADADPRLAARAAAPTRRGARPRDELRVQHRDGVAEALDEARDDLRRQRDLGHEHDHALAPALERLGRRAQVDLGLARAGDAVQQQLARRGGAVEDRARAPPPARGSAAAARAAARRPPCGPARGARPRGAIAHEPARLQPPQRRGVGAGEAAAASRSSARWRVGQPRVPRRDLRPRSAHSAVFARAPVRRQHSASARAGVEQYSAAIHSASSTRSARQRLLEHPPRRDELVLGLLAPARSTTPSSVWRPNGTSQQRPDADALRPLGSRTARAARGPSSAARPWRSAAARVTVARIGSAPPWTSTPASRSSSRAARRGASILELLHLGVPALAVARRRRRRR